MPHPAAPDADTDREKHVLVLNSGSSSLKFGLYRVGSTAVQRVFTGEAHAARGGGPVVGAVDADGRVLFSEDLPVLDEQAVVRRIAGMLAEGPWPPPQAIGHRVVHGGPSLRGHCRIDADVIGRLEKARAFAPLHLPAALDVIRDAQARFPGVPQVACFDTAFHAGMPDVARVLALPRAWRAQGVERYGFHGLSCESIVHQLAGALPQRLLIAHLGNGASITAVLEGASIDTTMGLTPSGGLIMGTRSGDLDPGVLVYLMRDQQLDADRMEDVIDHHSGLLGISGLGSDMRMLHDAAATNADAHLAVRMFCYAAAKALGAMSVALGGVDRIVFTGGIGENDGPVRAAICSDLACFGVVIDPSRNLDAHRTPGDPISSAESRCEVSVLPSQEDEQIARHTWALC